MTITYEKIEIHNFMSFVDETFEFEKYSGMTRIKGKNFDIPNQLNGAGKSNCIAALVYGLYGDLPYKLKNENISNRYTKDQNTFVTVYFHVGRKHYKVISGMKGKQSYCSLFLMNDEDTYEDITKSTMAETRAFIVNHILHCDVSMFMRTVVLNSDPTFNFYNLKMSDRKEFIDKLFDISMFTDMYEIEHNFRRSMEKEISMINSRLMILDKNADDYQQKIREFDENKERRISEIKIKLEQARTELEKRKSVTIEKNSELTENCQQKIRKVTDNLATLESNIQKMKSSVSDLERENKRISSNISDRTKIINKHTNLYSKLCDDCKPVYAKYHNLDTYQSEITSLTEKMGQNDEKIRSIDVRMSETISKKTEFEDKLLKLNGYLRKLTSEYETAQTEIRNSELYVNSLETQLENVVSQDNPYLTLEENNRKAKEAESENLRSTTKKFNVYRLSESIISQETLQKFIIHDMVGLLNNKMRYYLHKLGANCDVVFNDEMKFDFVTDVKSGVEFNNFSKGEQARISIATCFAFRDFLSTRSNISSNIFMLDEFFDSNVDPLALENTMEILKDFVKVNRQRIFIVSHRSEIGDDVFNNIIQVEKRDNISKLRTV